MRNAARSEPESAEASEARGNSELDEAAYRGCEPPLTNREVLP
jgi:outer membrane murein-binding lipoprotein Lpp